MIDHILDRITWNPKASVALSAAHHPSQLKPIPWPVAITPVIETYPFGDSSQPLPKVDSVIVTWTAAEWQALTDVLATAGGKSEPDVDYAHDFDLYRTDLTHKSPAASAHCLARVRLVGGNQKSVLLVHSMLHVATDGPNLPLRRLIDQVIDETGCSRLITTGTAGGISPMAQLGDVVVGNAIHFDCNKQFATAPFAHAQYQTSLMSSPVVIKDYLDDGTLIGANLDQLTIVRTDSQWATVLGTILTTDFFAFDTSTDHYGLQGYDPSTVPSPGNPVFGAVEMDDATFGLVMDDRKAAGKSTPWWAAIRNVSDPQMDMSKYATEEDAATAAGLIYRRNGYWTTIPSVIMSYLFAVA